jgi:hypothetical protein
MTLSIPKIHSPRSGESTLSRSSLTSDSGAQPSSTLSNWLGQVRIKCQIQDMRVIMAPLNITYADLMEKIKGKFQIPKQKILKLYYLDEEGDQIVMADHDDLNLAMSLQGVLSANPRNTMMIHGVLK